MFIAKVFEKVRHVASRVVNDGRAIVGEPVGIFRKTFLEKIFKLESTSAQISVKS
jgi:hypothetical protein